MQTYLDNFIQMISLRGLTDHTIKSYSTYIRAYLDYLDSVLLKKPEDVSWQELRDFIGYLQKNVAYQIELSMQSFRNFDFLLFTSFINLGIPINFLTASLMPIFLLFLQKGKSPRLSCHSFRHAFGTHLYENGTDLLTIKTLLGHKSLSSTTLYIQLASTVSSKVTSPFDTLKEA